ncbi:MAG: plasmid replication initiator TrfA, partial [Vulcanimicrobiaceae bacterium]
MALSKSIREKIAQNAAEATALALHEPLPNWPDRMRAAPNVLLRSALFGVGKRGPRTYVKEMPLPIVGDLVLTYTGERLDQADEDIFLAILHFARDRNVADVIRFPMRRLLRETDRNVGKTDYVWLHSRLVALTSCGVVIEDASGPAGPTRKKRIYAGALLIGATDETTSQAAFLLNPYLRAIFHCDDYTLLDADNRRALRGKQLAKWLHAYYATHSRAYPMKVATIMHLCGSHASDVIGFRRKLGAALDLLHDRKLIRCWRFEQREPRASGK